MSGFRLALKESVKYLSSSLTVKVDALNHQQLMDVAKTSMSSKLLNAESDFFAKLVVTAMQNVASSRRD